MTPVTAALLVAALAADPAPAPATPTPPEAAGPAGTRAARPGVRPVAATRASLPSVEGELEAIDHHQHRLGVRTPTGAVSLTFDRNTLVLGLTGAVTPLALAPGMRVKVGRDGDQRAAWVEVRASPPATPTSAP
jgi:hypothetical protein